MRYFLIGFMGSGKSHWGIRLAERLGLPFFDSDLEIEQREQKTTPEIFAGEGEEYFRLAEKEVMEELIVSHPACVIATGGGTPCFYNNIELMKREGLVIWLNCPVDLLVSRLLDGKSGRPLLRDLDDEHLRQYIVKKLSDRSLYYRQAQLWVEEENLSIEKLLEQIESLSVQN